MKPIIFYDPTVVMAKSEEVSVHPAILVENDGCTPIIFLVPSGIDTIPGWHTETNISDRSIEQLSEECELWQGLYAQATFPMQLLGEEWDW